MKNFRLICHLFSLVVMATVYNGCGLGKGNATQSCVSVANSAVSDNFSTTLYPDLVTNCAKCHGDLGPQDDFAGASASSAESTVKTYIDFADPSNSQLMTIMSSDAEMCVNESCAQLTTLLTKDIQAWAATQLAQATQVCTSDATGQIEVKTSAQTVTTAQLSTTTPLTLTWDLSQVVSSLTGVSFRTQILGVTDPSTSPPSTSDFYQFQDLQLGTSSGEYEISDIHIYLNGGLANYLNFAAVDFVVLPQAYTPSSASWPFPDVSTNIELVEWGNGFSTTSDQIQFDFFINPSTAAQGAVTTSGASN